MARIASEVAELRRSVGRLTSSIRVIEAPCIAVIGLITALR